MENLRIFDENGNLSIFLQMQIARYSKENNIKKEDVFSALRTSGFSVKEWCLMSFYGYKSFEIKINLLRAEQA